MHARHKSGDQAVGNDWHEEQQETQRSLVQVPRGVCSGSLLCLGGRTAVPDGRAHGGRTDPFSYSISSLVCPSFLVPTVHMLEPIMDEYFLSSLVGQDNNSNNEENGNLCSGTKIYLVYCVQALF